MKDSQQANALKLARRKYIKESNERFSTCPGAPSPQDLSISRRVMKDSQPQNRYSRAGYKYIKESNERFSTRCP